MTEDNYEDDVEYIDIEGTILALHAAWKLVPDVSLSQLLDTVTSMPFCEMSSDDLITELNSFIHQNQ